MTKADQAVAIFKEGYNCAQSVLCCYAGELQISRDMALRIANGFGGGMGRKQEVCGAISGGIMVLGLMYGRGENDGKEKQEITFAKVRNLIESFTAECGTVNCRELLSGCALLTPEGQNTFRDNGLIEKCYNYVRRVIAIIEKNAF
ncbi:MAG: C_GCAxxG_C_C family protein [Chitinispirillaceae bacterium]|nr:C_GCAxxG_C_C family protein [Chitinispirillaceae bacterium]